MTGRAESLEDGVRMAEQLIDNGVAQKNWKNLSGKAIGKGEQNERKYPCKAIAEKQKNESGEERRKIPLFEMRNNAEAVAAFGTGRQNCPTFYQALAKPECPFICEVKSVTFQRRNRRRFSIPSDSRGIRGDQGDRHLLSDGTFIIFRGATGT